jgi:hypothetical protein
MNCNISAGGQELQDAVALTGQEKTTMPLLQCEVLEGPREGFKVVGVASIEGHSEYLTIDERFLVKRHNRYLLPVRIIGKDRQHDTLLVQLPYEADSGANRVWVKKDAVQEPDEVPA